MFSEPQSMALELDEDKALMNAGDKGRIVKVEIPIFQRFGEGLMIEHSHELLKLSARELAEQKIRTLLVTGIFCLVPDSEGGEFFLFEKERVRVPRKKWLKWIFELVSTPKRSSW